MSNETSAQREQSAHAAEAVRTVGRAGEIQVDDLNIAYWLSGDSGPVILFLHGNSSCKEAFHQQFETLRNSGLRLLAFDLPGHGCSSDASAPETQYTVTFHVRVVRHLLRALDIVRPLVFGWSLGGHLALELAGRGMDLAGIMISGTPPTGPGPDFRKYGFLPVTFELVTDSADPTIDELAQYVRSTYGRTVDIAQFFYDAALRTDGRAREEVSAHWARGDDGCSQRIVAQGWDGTMAVLHGARDPFIDRDYLDRIDWRNLWGGRIIDIADAGHAAFFDKPDIFTPLLLDFANDMFCRPRNDQH